MRYLDPTSGRFLTEGPAKDGLNWFSYCDGTPVKFKDPSGLTITLTGTDEEKQKSFNQLQMLTNNKLYMDSNTGVVSIVEGSMNTDKTLTAGTKMIADMIGNENFDGQIQRTYLKDNGCWANFTKDGAIITMNDWAEEGGNWFYEVSNGKGGTTYDDHKDVAHIILGHELIHATHHMNGTIPSNANLIYYIDGSNKVGIDINMTLNINEEYSTVGLIYYVPASILVKPDANKVINSWIRKTPLVSILPFKITENTLRAEQGLARRTAY